MRIFILLCLFSIDWLIVSAQSPTTKRGDQAYHTYDRMEILKQGDTSLVNGINNLNSQPLYNYFKNVWTNADLTDKDRYDLMHYFSDNYEFLTSKPKEIFSRDNNNFNEPKDDLEHEIFKETFDKEPILKYFYKTPANFLQLETPSFKLYVNPILQLSYLNQKDNENPIFVNTRGINARAYIDDKVYIFTQLLETQRSYLSYTEDRNQKFSTLPGQGFWKPYNSTLINNLKGYDFFNAKAYFGFNAIKSINVEFGHGNHFIGNGYRSLLLSDYSNNYLFLKLNTRIWKFQYQNIFAELSPTTAVALSKGDKLLPKKYTAMHYLAFKPNTSFEIGLFESVVFSRTDHFEFQYLNPVILYRAIEHTIGSPDNVILGINTKWNIVKGISLYGQFVMDEFKLSEVKKQSGWWANKFGVQAGIKYMNALGIDHLDLQVEYNAVRPYTYAHRDTLPGTTNVSVANFSHSNQPLAHPLGANFKELILIAQYKPINRLYIQAKGLMTTYGDDPLGQNWGGNILLPLQTIQMEYGNYIGQGIKTKVVAMNFDVSYEVFHNYFIDLQTMWRQTTTDVKKDQHYIGGGFRINLSNITYDY